MKRLTLCVLIAFVFLLFIPVVSSAETATAPVDAVAVHPAASADVSVFVARVEAINAMDLSAINASERKELRKELRAIKTGLKKKNAQDIVATHGNGGIYLSVGAIIVIVLVLILIL